MDSEDKSALAMIAVYVGVILLNLAFWGGVIYCAIHFIRKFW